MPALFFSTGTPTTDTYTLSLHDALPISAADKDRRGELIELRELADGVEHDDVGPGLGVDRQLGAARSEEHTSELQSLTNLVCRLLLEKKNLHRVDKDDEKALKTPIIAAV